MNTQGMNGHRISGILAICGLFTMISAAHAEVYKTVDKDGNVVYTDQPPEPGAEPMKLRELSVVPVPQYASKDKAVQTAGLEEGQDVDLGALRRGYRDFSLVSPVQDQSFNGTGNVATIAWETRFELQPGMSVIVYIDNQALPPSTATVINTPPLDRGEHQVRAELVDEQQRRIASAGPVSFHVRQESALFNNAPTPTPRGGG